MEEKTKKIGLWCLVGVLGAAAVGGVGSALWMHERLRAFETAKSNMQKPTVQNVQERYCIVREGDDLVSLAIAYGVSPSKLREANHLAGNQDVSRGMKLLLPPEAQLEAPKPVQNMPAKKESAEQKPVVVPPAALAIEKVVYDGDDRIDVCFTETPDMDVMREYLTVGPVNGGTSFSSSGRRVIVRGDFLYRTNLTLRVRGGCPVQKGGKLKPLAHDYVQTLQRKDAPPRVQFVDTGRYLPPGGARMLAVDSVNVAKIHCAAAAVPSANIVQLLARENGHYGRYDDDAADSKCTEDLADKFVEWKLETMGRTNEHVTSPFALRNLPDAASNGVFLVAVRSGDVPREDWRSWWSDRRGEKWNPNRYRLVCLTDVGLTVRRSGKRLVVWATSLMTGAPVTNCVVDVYGANNRQIAQGRTDGTGLCDVVCSDRADPFAVVARTADGADTSFVCLAGRQSLDERWLPEGARDEYLKPDDVAAFVWTERDIYRHDEKMLLHALVRNGRNVAPKPFPVELRLLDPDGVIFQRKTVVSDAYGAVWSDAFSVPAERPSGTWTVVVATPGKDGVTLGSHDVNVEEFAPPQIRVKTTAQGDWGTNFAFTVAAEHLYGGPARGLRSEGAVVFEDAAFAPAAWKGWTFGNESLGLNPNYRRLAKLTLDEKGTALFSAPIFADYGHPKAAVKAMGEGTVFEEGGRPARGRTTRVVHCYPFYVGTTLGGNMRIPATGHAKVKVACVRPDGTRLPEARKLKVAFEHVESVYSCKEDDRGWTTWHCDRVRVPIATPVKELETKADGDVELEIPFRVDGDYALTLTDEAAGTSFGASFWLGSRGDDAVRAPLANPSEVTITPDKKIYRPGDVPRLLVKAPFAGWALVTVLRDGIVSRRVLKMDGATQEISIEPVDGAWAPNVDVSLSVVQSAENGGRRQTVRAHGLATLAVRRWENEIPVQVKTSYVVGESGGGTLTADVTATSAAATGCVAVVTVVDEGIHLLTDWKTPDPVGRFAELRTGEHPLHDLFENLLPVWDGDPAKVRGIKTGGGCGADLFGRVSPVPSRRFKPLACWRTSVALTNGAGRVVFDLPEFVGEVRVTALAYSTAAVGAGDVRQKVTPKLILQADAPRFAAPGDAFAATLTLANRSGSAGEVTWLLEATGAVKGERTSSGRVKLDKDGSQTLNVTVAAGAVPGSGMLKFWAEGLGERHTQVIELPVRPAVAARETSGTLMLGPGESHAFSVSPDGAVPEAAVRQFTPNGSALAQLLGALEYLAEYPHGCLEQTTSRIFPLVAAGGFLNRLAVEGAVGKATTNRAAYVEAGVRRVESMIRANDFVMWPDCTYAPWDREVSLYASHFLLSAEQGGVKLNVVAKNQVMDFLKRWSVSTNLAVSAYACHTLALAGVPASDRMLVLFDARARLAPIDRARLARAFARTGDRARAAQLLGAGVERPATLKEGAFNVLALLDLDPADARLAPLVRQLESTRQADRFSWGTTEENAHALLALGAFYRHHPVKDGKAVLVRTGADGRVQPLPEKNRTLVRGAETVTISNKGDGGAWLTWRSLELPKPETVTNETSGIRIARTYHTPEGLETSLANVARGDLLVVELTLSSDEARTYNDLVIQDLLPAAFEPVLGGLDPSIYDWIGAREHDWVMRGDARDDRMLVFSKKFSIKAGGRVRYHYPVRVVSTGDFTLPGVTVEAMYAPSIRAVAAPGKVVVAK